MNVLIDTSVWSLALRRAKRLDDTHPNELAELIREGRVVMLGPVRQELLSGIKIKAQFESLREHLRSFPDLELESMDYEDAALAFNRCRERGIQGSNTDFLICAAARRRDLTIYATDDDFLHYAKVLRLALHQPRA
ncbi:MAG TPA: PIN domain-containing protein [Polyangiaceae bacterium]